MKKFIFSILTLTVVALILVGCASTPEEEPAATQPPPDTAVEPESGTQKPEAAQLTDEDFEQVRLAIVRAEEAGATDYAPEELNNAKEALEAAESSEGDKAQESLNIAMDWANKAYEIASEKSEQDLISRINTMMEKLKNLEADKFSPEEYGALAQRATNIELAFDTSFQEGKTKSESLLQDITTTYNKLDEKIRWVKILQRDTENYLSDAEKAEAYIWASEELDKANDYYFTGLNAYRNYNLGQGEESLSQAKYYALEAGKAAKERKAQKETEDFMMEVMKEIENASQMTVVSDDDEIVTPAPWQGENLLDSTYSTEGEQESEEPTKEEASKPQAILLPANGEVAVLGDEDVYSYLNKAQELWLSGVKEKNAGNMAIANQYFGQAQSYIRLYQDKAVNAFYTVKYNPELRDCLWRIAERKDVYNNPYLWPKIWRRNKKLIQNPDLIYPGWNLIIPPK
ncbi:LysM peptidoglycan-binding domain-containing protein [Spirochaeta cellobiosiphila]|uniref:LysM peptidoglycan-binding domain-containing protein n=1 Tax=Spirochaeta cellobiosiphila TaxID=504483 RepID=UPI00040C428B|nr:DUF4398 domain-containing protein [Spirochaeta cellobiosiphila]